MQQAGAVIGAPWVSSLLTGDVEENHPRGKRPNKSKLLSRESIFTSPTPWSLPLSTGSSKWPPWESVWTQDTRCDLDPDSFTQISLGRKCELMVDTWGQNSGKTRATSPCESKWEDRTASCMGRTQRIIQSHALPHKCRLLCSLREILFLGISHTKSAQAEHICHERPSSQGVLRLSWWEQFEGGSFTTSHWQACIWNSTEGIQSNRKSRTGLSLQATRLLV
jgi:hypothetical protein